MTPRRSQFGGVDLYRILIASSMLGILFTTLSWLQGRFDQSDHRKAVTLVKTYQPQAGGPSLTERIIQDYPGLHASDLSWDSEIRSSCLGYVRVTARADKTKTHRDVALAFDVDLTGPSIHPGDAQTVGILRSLQTSTTSTVGSK
jgi:hypothetical protein